MTVEWEIKKGREKTLLSPTGPGTPESVSTILERFSEMSTRVLIKKTLATYNLFCENHPVLLPENGRQAQTESAPPMALEENRKNYNFLDCRRIASHSRSGQDYVPSRDPISD